MGRQEEEEEEDWNNGEKLTKRWYFDSSERDDTAQSSLLAWRAEKTWRLGMSLTKREGEGGDGRRG